MKLKLLIIIALCTCQMAFGQDSLRVETVQDSAFSTPQYIGAFDDVFLSRKESKWLLKLDLIPLFKDEFMPGTQGVGLEFECKLARKLSINTGLFADGEVLDENAFYRPISFIAEPKVFLGRKAINNLNGQYISLRTQVSKHVGSSNVLGDLSYLNEKNISLNYGLQKRVFNFWYVNYRVGLGYTERQKVKNTNWDFGQKQEFGLETQFSFGLAFGGGKRSKIETCDVFRCFEEEKSLLKLDVRGVLAALRKDAFWTTSVIGYEFKLKQPQWSLNLEARPYYFGSQSDGNISFKARNIKMSAGAEPRYYYNLKRRIASGKSANNLSGNYFSIAVFFTHEKDVYENIPKQPEDFERFYSKQRYERNYITIAPKFGMQRRLFKHGFVDVSFAPLQFSYGRFNKRRNELANDWFGLPVIDTKLGFAF